MNPDITTAAAPAVSPNNLDLAQMELGSTSSLLRDQMASKFFHYTLILNGV
jgi:hypothetical protein